MYYSDSNGMIAGPLPKIKYKSLYKIEDIVITGFCLFFFSSSIDSQFGLIINAFQ